MNCNILIIHINDHYWRCLNVVSIRQNFTNVALIKKLIDSYLLLHDIIKPFITALHKAALYGRTEVAMFLINSGADVNLKTRMVSDMGDRNNCLRK